MKKTAFQSLALMLAMLLMLSLLASCSSTKQPAETPDSDQQTGTTTNDQDDANTPDDSDEPADTEIPEFQLPIVDEPVTVKFWWPTVEEMLEDKGYDKSDAYLYFQEMEK